MITATSFPQKVWTPILSLAAQAESPISDEDPQSIFLINGMRSRSEALSFMPVFADLPAPGSTPTWEYLVRRAIQWRAESGRKFSTAIGPYQIMGGTSSRTLNRRALVESLQETSQSLSSIADLSSQRRVATRLLLDKLGRFRYDLTNPVGMVSSLVRAASATWAGIPNSSGRSSYAGQAGNKSTVSANAATDAAQTTLKLMSDHLSTDRVSRKDVRTVQSLLNRFGASLKVDGLVGPMTLAAWQAIIRRPFPRQRAAMFSALTSWAISIPGRAALSVVRTIFTKA